MDSAEDHKKVKIQKRVYRLRKEGKTWNDVSVIVSKEFDSEVSSKKAQDLYDNHIAKAQVITQTLRESKREAVVVEREWNNEMKSLFEEIKKRALKHLEIADELLVSQYKDNNTKAYFKNLPAAISLMRSILDQINFLGKRLEKIEINQKSTILSETQMLQIVNKAWAQKEKETGMTIHPGTGQLIPLKKRKKLKVVS